MELRLMFAEQALGDCLRAFVSLSGNWLRKRSTFRLQHQSFPRDERPPVIQPVLACWLALGRLRGFRLAAAWRWSGRTASILVRDRTLAQLSVNFDALCLVYSATITHHDHYMTLILERGQIT